MLYEYKVLNEIPKYVQKLRIGAHFTLPCLGATARAAAIAHFSLKKSAYNNIGLHSYSNSKICI